MPQLKILLLDKGMKKWVDNASYATLLRRWRFAPIGDPFFMGEMGDYFAKVMSAKQAALSHQEQVSASKSVGWDKE